VRRCTSWKQLNFPLEPVLTCVRRNRRTHDIIRATAQSTSDLNVWRTPTRATNCVAMATNVADLFQTFIYKPVQRHAALPQSVQREDNCAQSGACGG